MDIIKLLDRPHYKSMTNLLILFYQEKKICNGLRQAHFRYALIKKHKLPKKTFREMKAVFGSKLQEYYDKNEIIPNCINKNTNLSNYLKILEKYDLIKKNESGSFAHYLPTKKLLTIHYEERINNLMKLIIESNNIHDFPYKIDHHAIEHNIDFKKLKNLCENNNISSLYMLTKSWILSGFSYWHLKKLLENDDFVNAIFEIEKNLWKISKIFDGMNPDLLSTIGFMYRGGLHRLPKIEEIKKYFPKITFSEGQKHILREINNHNSELK